MFEQRPYFVVGDLACNAMTGAVVAVVVVSLGVVIEGWPSLVGMLVGMLVGHLVAAVLSMMASALFGAFEVMLPMMTTGMVVGMMAGMSAAGDGMTTGAASARGALVGLAVLVGTYFLNAYVKSRGDVWTS